MENFPWTRLFAPGVEMPTTQRPMVDLAKVRLLDPVALREYLGDGNYGGLYQRPDADMLALWEVAVEETRALLTGSWGDA
jgi:creatinine amidohydrolase